MALEKLLIQNTDTKEELKALFNPKEYSITKTTNWEETKQVGQDSPDKQFTGGEGRTLTIELFFDTYSLKKKTNVKEYIDKLETLMLLDVEKHRPPILLVSWGKKALNFQCVLTNLTQKYTMFLSTGMPVRATADVIFKEYTSNVKEKQSPDHTKVRIFKSGDSLQMLAYLEYEDINLWKILAEHNNIDDPMNIKAGTIIEIPPIIED